jgi:hypothetical protein
LVGLVAEVGCSAVVEVVDVDDRWTE